VIAVTLHQLTALLYALAGLAAGIGVVFGRQRASRLGVGLLALGAVAHAAAFSLLHTADPPPPLTDMAMAMSLTAFVGTLAYLALLRRFRVLGLAAPVAALAFVCAAIAALRLPHATTGPEVGGSLPHAHVLLASAGLALQGLAALAGALFLAEHRRLKRRLPLAPTGLPSLEALDRAGSLALAVGFPLLTLAVLTGALWVYEDPNAALSGSAHEIGTLIAWAVSAALTFQRFVTHQGARRCALSALLSFGLFSVAVLGVELWT
jgi:ABC-type transport system involved in cytochrome c biogenesis permease subunit